MPGLPQVAAEPVGRRVTAEVVCRDQSGALEDCSLNNTLSDNF